MSSQIEPLKFPDHFPPKDFWNKFFIGVRRIGPDLSFFKDIEKQQGARDIQLLCLWGGGIRQEIAEAISTELCKSQKWASNVFIPQDMLAVIWNGPRFQSIDDLTFEHALNVIEKKYNLKIPQSFWNGLDVATFGEFVDKFIALLNWNNFPGRRKLRELSENEKYIIANFAKELPNEIKEQLLADASNSVAKEVTLDSSVVMFEISGYQRPSIRGQHQFGVEGSMLDGDSVKLSVFLYADANNRLLELEIIRWDTNGTLLGPQWETLNVIPTSPLTYDSKGQRIR